MALKTNYLHFPFQRCSGCSEVGPVEDAFDKTKQGVLPLGLRAGFRVYTHVCVYIYIRIYIYMQFYLFVFNCLFNYLSLFT